ncbi:MAG: 23S rRNA (adenine(2503)-C(2))-methyltransferase RlmN [Lachnospiraceae bacterium]|nr:23S rRNA (adenine(2503)-C(2))-methyltransferase RlmN [Lachnospiraceae bacterium]
MKPDIKSYTLDELKNIMTDELGEKPFRAAQIYRWLHVALCTSFDEMTNISAGLREKLKEHFELSVLVKEQLQVSKIDGTAKYLFKLGDGNRIESVLMKYKHGNSVCISSQAGCRMGCKFCASTLDGLARNLLPGEMLDQIYRIQADTGERVDNIVIMGCGEPLDNFDNVTKFLKMISDENGLNISQRNITVSTCGLVPKIRELAELNLQITLAISLHAPNDDIRKNIMPVANKYSIEELLSACDYYFMKTGRRITFEYSLINGVNDSLKEARELAERIKHINSHVNLIPINPIKERSFRQGTQEEISEFKKLLEKNKINVTIRREMGRDIQGACGQLRKSYSEQETRTNDEKEEEIF